MRHQKVITAVIFALSFSAVSASAAIINNVEFPEAYVQAQEKSVQVQEEQVTASAEVNK